MKLKLLTLPFLLASVVHANPKLKVDISVSGNKMTCTPTIENGNIADYTFSYQWLRSFQNIKNDIYGKFPNSAFEENTTTLPTVSLKNLKNGIFHWTRCKIIATPKEGNKLYSLSIPKKLTVINLENVLRVTNNRFLKNGELYDILSDDKGPYKIKKLNFPEKISKVLETSLLTKKTIFVNYENGKLSTIDKQFIELPSTISLIEDKVLYNGPSVLLNNGDIYYIDDNSPYKTYKISLPARAQKIFSTSYNFYARLENGEVYSWNKSLISNENIIYPIAKDILKNMLFVNENQGFSSTYILNSQGELFAKGNNYCGINILGCLGISDTQSNFVEKEQKLIFPLPVERILSNDLDYPTRFVKLVDGSLWGWGNNISDGVGIDSTDNVISQPQQIKLPSPIKELVQYRNENFNFSGFSYLALLENGELYGWGKNIFNANSQSINSKLPIKIDFPKKIKSIKYNDRFIKIIFDDYTKYTDQPDSVKVAKDNIIINENGNLYLVKPKYLNVEPININIPSSVINTFGGKNFNNIIEGYAITKTDEIFYFKINEKNEQYFRKLESDLDISKIIILDEYKIIISDE
ncbi:hypothetical protein QEJ31_00860 [Pigmentibacter sp. JX0631]|uniref:hypothetical protein n=1 Tax=Pigmentibacter sp. JX0631 TaxID=2976982 RepID=UPI002468C5E0|nr:hypothetical protein [Pigmentibacter sp. JX0631]WGL60153.1 hypothetical protein QEJ31_00860 [Pigmentibacter sp. JX0631]